MTCSCNRTQLVDQCVCVCVERILCLLDYYYQTGHYPISAHVGLLYMHDETLPAHTHTHSYNEGHASLMFTAGRTADEEVPVSCGLQDRNEDNTTLIYIYIYLSRSKTSPQQWSNIYLSNTKDLWRIRNVLCMSLIVCAWVCWHLIGWHACGGRSFWVRDSTFICFNIFFNIFKIFNLKS